MKTWIGFGIVLILIIVWFSSKKKKNNFGMVQTGGNFWDKVKDACCSRKS